MVFHAYIATCSAYNTLSSTSTWNNIIDALRSSTVRSQAGWREALTQHKSLALLPPTIMQCHHKLKLGQLHYLRLLFPIHQSLPPPTLRHHSHTPPNPYLGLSLMTTFHQPAIHRPLNSLIHHHHAEADSTSSILPPFSQLLHVTPEPPPSRSIPPTPVPVQQTTLRSDAVKSMGTHQRPIQPEVAAGM